MNESPIYNPEAEADVCLLLEGTYPYVRGGVSTWVKQIIEGMPELRFSLIYLGASASTHVEPAYAIPDNVVHIEVHFLLDEEEENFEKPSFWKRARKNRKKYEKNSKLHDELREDARAQKEDGVVRQSSLAVTQGFTELLAGKQMISEEEMKTSEMSWEVIREKYATAPEGLDFNHYFWTVRSMHAPLFVLGEIVRNAPVPFVYHSVSTGYAGFLGSMLSQRNSRPYVISEHGIYTKERELDLAQVDWIPKDLDPFNVGLNDNMSYLRDVWIRFFRSLGRMSYVGASQVFSLYEGNRVRQIADGAAEHKLSIIPNGVDVNRFSQCRRDPSEPVPPVLALIGRVVPIKDIKNFVRAMRIICSEIPDAKGWLIGPQDEDPAYTEECKQLVASMELEESISFLGFQTPEEVFRGIGLSVLTSVSEGQPLAVLEGFAAGLPAVTTDVGSCSELIYGSGEEDEAMGSAGAVVPIADPAAFASAAIELLQDKDKWSAASAAAIQRVETYYDEVTMIERYRDMYQLEMNTPLSKQQAI